jgi:hypothetical protein
MVCTLEVEVDAQCHGVSMMSFAESQNKQTNPAIENVLGELIKDFSLSSFIGHHEKHINDIAGLSPGVTPQLSSVEKHTEQIGNTVARHVPPKKFIR